MTKALVLCLLLLSCCSAPCRSHMHQPQHRFSNDMKNLPPSDVPSKSKAVWEKFSRWSDFETKLYHYGTFPQDFLWGVFSSAYQVEGGWDADGKGPSIWDTFTQTSGNILENANGNIACDSYNKVDQDLALIQDLGVTSYRFSISWSRLFPDGTVTSLNPNGVNYYNRLIDGLVGLGVAPVVTLYHWDLPQALQNTGGWENHNMVTLFDQYADFCFKTFGDRVKFWITFNDPFSIAWKGYGSGELPPNLSVAPGVAPYTVGKVLLLAHATAYRTYDRLYRPLQRGVVSIALNGDWFEPKDVNVVRELEAADRAMQFTLGWFAHPIFRNGDYPEAMKLQVEAKSALQRLEASRLPALTEDEQMLIRGTADVFCLNHLTTRIARFSMQALTPPSYATDRDLEEEDLNYPHTSARGPRAVPWGLRRALNWVKHEYGDPLVFVSDNAMGTNRHVGTDDADRTFFLKSYIDEALKALVVDGVRLRGYLGAALLDGFEWLQGFTAGSGLHWVDFTNPALSRTPKFSARVYKQILRSNGFPRGDDETPLYGFFRPDMMWATSTSAFQIEGGWLSEGKGPSVWDLFSHTPGKVRDGDNGDTACNSLRRVDEDVEQLRLIGARVYRFSISWSRVIANGSLSSVNEEGIKYYEQLVDRLLQAGITPLVTLYHWDMPTQVHYFGGWTSTSTKTRFLEYADLMFRRLGPKVKWWITFNEPWVFTMLGYCYGSHAPGIPQNCGSTIYRITHNILKTHADVWHLYDDKYRSVQRGKVSISLNSDWSEPRDPDLDQDREAAQRHLQFSLGWFAHPIFVGDYPILMKEIIANRSAAAGEPRSRLPQFTNQELRRIRGTHDFFGLNHYTTVLTSPGNYSDDEQTYDADRGTQTTSDWTWLEAGSEWLKLTPFGIRRLLRFIKEEYGNPPILITENGVSDRGPTQLNDTLRQHFYNEYINQVLKASVLDGVDVIGYTAWSLMDNFEWASGYSETFGLFYVNRSDPALPRTPKVSVQTYSTIIRCNGFPDPASDHECLTPPTEPPIASIAPPGLSFLGFDLTFTEAETGLNATFALLVVMFVVAVATGGGVFLIRRKKQDDVRSDPDLTATGAIDDTQL